MAVPDAASTVYKLLNAAEELKWLAAVQVPMANRQICYKRIKTYLRTSMTQLCLNNAMVMHIHKDLTESINHLQVLNEFASANEERIRSFGCF